MNVYVCVFVCVCMCVLVCVCVCVCVCTNMTKTKFFYCSCLYNFKSKAKRCSFVPTNMKVVMTILKFHLCTLFNSKVIKVFTCRLLKKTKSNSNVRNEFYKFQFHYSKKGFFLHYSLFSSLKSQTAA